jgi:predicted transcriptional regulator
MPRNNRRSKIEIIFDVLTAIRDEELDNRGVVKPTRIQHRSKISYDKMRPYIDELKNLHLITNLSLTITEKGLRFLTDYNKIKESLDKLEQKYFY